MVGLLTSDCYFHANCSEFVVLHNISSRKSLVLALIKFCSNHIKVVFMLYYVCAMLCLGYSMFPLCLHYFCIMLCLHYVIFVYVCAMLYLWCVRFEICYGCIML